MHFRGLLSAQPWLIEERLTWFMRVSSFLRGCRTNRSLLEALLRCFQPHCSSLTSETGLIVAQNFWWGGRPTADGSVWSYLVCFGQIVSGSNNPILLSVIDMSWGDTTFASNPVTSNHSQMFLQVRYWPGRIYEATAFKFAKIKLFPLYGSTLWQNWTASWNRANILHIILRWSYRGRNLHISA